jgi:hypothetical protein
MDFHFTALQAWLGARREVEEMERVLAEWERGAT